MVRGIDPSLPLFLGDAFHKEMKTRMGSGEAEAWHLGESREAEEGTIVLDRVLVPWSSW